jgi:hypothetical protein
MTFDPFNVDREMFGCCAYRDKWEPDMAQWGPGDYLDSYVATVDYDRLLAMYCEAKGIPFPTTPISIEEINQREDEVERRCRETEERVALLLPPTSPVPASPTPKDNRRKDVATGEWMRLNDGTTLTLDEAIQKAAQANYKAGDPLRPVPPGY